MLGPMLRAAAGNRGGGIPTDGLIAHWTMDNIVGSTLVDETGNYDGSISGAVSVPGVIGNALSFDGVNDVVSVALAMPSDFTVSCWLDTTSLTGDMCLFGSGTASSDSIFLYATTNFGSAVNQLRLFGVGVEIAVGSDIRATGYRHIVLSRAGDSWSVYIDAGYDTGGSAPGTVAAPFNIGDSTYVSRLLNGHVDQFRIYNRALSLSEITALYNEV